MTISFSGLASGLDTSSWITSLTQLRQAKVTKLEEQKSTIATAQTTLQGIRSFFASFRSSIEKITDSKFKVSNMDIFSKKIAEVSNAAVLSATAKSNAAEGSYEVKVNNIATQTQAKSGYRYKTVLVSTTQATTSSSLKNVGVGYGTNPESGITAGNIEITHNDVTSTISISANETMNSFLDKLHAVGIEAEFDNDTGIFSIGVNASDINDVGNTNILSKLKISDINYGYTCDQLKIEEESEIFHQATNDTLLSALGVSPGTITVNTANGLYEVTLDEEDTVGTLVAALRSEGIEATFSEGVFSINNAYISDDGETGLIEAFGLTAPEIASQTQQSGGLTYQTVYTSTTTAQLDTLLKDIDGVTLEGDETILVQDASGNNSVITVGTSTSIEDMIGYMNDAGLSVSYDEETGVLKIENGWIIDGGTFDVEAAFGLEYTGIPGLVTGSQLTSTTTTITGATGGTKLKDLTTAVTSGTIKVTDTTENVHNLVIDENETINQLVNDIRELGLGASFDDTTGVLTLVGGSYTTEGIAPENASNVLSVFFGQNTLEPTAVDSAASSSTSLRETTVTTHNATGTTSLGQLGLNEGTYTATFRTGSTDVEVTINQNTTMSGLVSALRTGGLDAAFDSETSSIAINDGTFVGVTGGNFDTIMNFTETTTGRYATSDIVLAQGVTTGREMTSAGTVYHTVSTTTTISTTVTTTTPTAATSDPLTYQSITTTTTGGTEGLDIEGTALSYGSVSSSGTTQSTQTLTYVTTEIGAGSMSTVGMESTSSTVYQVTTSATSQTSSTLEYDIVTNNFVTTTTGQTSTGGTLLVGETTAANQTSGTLTYTQTSVTNGYTETTPIGTTQTSTITYTSTELDPGYTTTVMASESSQTSTLNVVETITTPGTLTTTAVNGSQQTDPLTYITTEMSAGTTTMSVGTQTTTVSQVVTTELVGGTTTGITTTMVSSTLYCTQTTGTTSVYALGTKCDQVIIQTQGSVGIEQTSNTFVIESTIGQQHTQYLTYRAAYSSPTIANCHNNSTAALVVQYSDGSSQTFDSATTLANLVTAINASTSSGNAVFNENNKSFSINNNCSGTTPTVTDMYLGLGMQDRSVFGTISVNTTTTPADGTTTLEDAGYSGSRSDCITLNNGEEISFNNAVTTFNDLVGLLEAQGVTASFSNGQLTVGSSSDTTYITNINSPLAAFLGISAGEGASYNSNGTINRTMTSATTLGELYPQGQNTGYAFKTYDGTIHSFTSTNTVGNVISEMEALGYNVSLIDGSLAIDPLQSIQTGNIIVEVGETLCYALHMDTGLLISGEGITYVEGNADTTCSSILKKWAFVSDANTTYSLSSTLSNLGLCGYIIDATNGNSITVTDSMTLGQLLHSVQTMGISMTITGDENTIYWDDTGSYDTITVSFTGGQNVAISNIDMQYFNPVPPINPLDFGYGRSFTYSDPYGTITASNTLADFGWDENDLGYIVYNDGVTHRVDSEMTFGDLAYLMSRDGMTTSLNNGQFTFSGNNSSLYFTYISDNLLDFFGGTLDYGDGITYNTSGGQYQTVTSLATGTTTLGELGLTHDAVVELYHYNASTTTYYTVTFGTDTTLYEMKENAVFCKNASDAKFRYDNGRYINEEGTIPAGATELNFSLYYDPNRHITYIDEDLANILHLDYTTTVTGQSPQNVTHTATGTTTFGTLGLTAQATITTDTGIVTVNTDTTIDDLADDLYYNHDIWSIFSDYNGRLTIGSYSNDHYIVSIEGGDSGGGISLGEILHGLQVGEGHTYNTSGSPGSTTTTTTQATGTTTMAELGMEGLTGTIVTNNTTITVSATNTVNDVIDMLDGEVTSLPDWATYVMANAGTIDGVSLEDLAAANNGFIAEVVTVAPQVTVVNAADLASAISNYTTIGIGSSEALAELATLVNSGTTCSGKTIVLTSDLDLTAICEANTDGEGVGGWTAIGTSDNNFQGTFNGNGHTISGLYINQPEYNNATGLFGNISGATISNVYVEGDVTGNSNVGILVGTAINSEITNCHTSGTVTSNNYAGGLVGYISGESDQHADISNCYSTADVNSNNNAGGLIGEIYYYVYIHKCYATGNVTGDAAGGLASLVGRNSYIEDCYATGNVVAEEVAGGLVASATGDISDSYASGDVTGVNMAGGFAGLCAANVGGCYSTGNVFGNLSSGGFVGVILANNDNNNGKSLIKSFATGLASGNSTATGTFVGFLQVDAGYSFGFGTNAALSNDEINMIGTSQVSGTASGLGNITELETDGLNVSLVNGVFTVEPGDDDYLVSISPNLAAALGINAGEGITYNLDITPPSSLTSVHTATTETTLGELGMSGSEGSFTLNDGTVINVTANTSIGSLVSDLAAAGIESASFSNGIFTVGDEEDTNFITRISSNVAAVLGIVAGEGITYNVNTQNASITTSTTTIDATTTMYQLGMHSSGTITLSNGETITVNTNSTVGSVLEALQDSPNSITCSLTDGVISIGDENDDNYITAMSSNIAAALGIEAGIDNSYTVSGVTASTNSTLAALGMTGSSGVIKTDNNTVTVSATDTIQDVIDALTDPSVGLGATLTDGVFQITPQNGHYLKSMSSNLAAALNIEVGYGSSYGVNIENNSTTDHQTATSETTMSQLGLASSGKIVTSNNETVTVLTTDTINSLIHKLSDAEDGVGISASYNPSTGIFTLGSTSDTYSVVSVTENLSSILGLEAGDGFSYNTSSVTASATATLAELGMSGASAVIMTDCQTVTVAASASINDLVAALNAEGVGLDVTFEDSQLTITPAEGHFLKSMSSNLANVLGMEVGYGSTYSVSLEGASYNSSTLTATGTTTFAELGLTNNGYMVTNLGQTINVLKTASINDLITALSDSTVGITATFSDGIFTLGDPENDDNFITYMSSGVAAVLGLESGEGHSFNTTTNTVWATTDTVLSTLGMPEDTEGVIRTNSSTITISSSQTIQDVIDALEDAGFEASLNAQHKLSISPTGDNYIESISVPLATALGIEAGLNVSYHNVDEETSTEPVTATLGTTLSTLGLTNNGSIITNNNTVTALTTDSLQNLITKLDAVGITASYNEETGIFTLGNSGDDNYVTAISPSLASVLGNMMVGQNVTYTYGTDVQEQEQVNNSLETVTSSCTFGQIGITSGGVINLSNGETVTVNSGTTIGDFITDIGNKGINVTLSNGLFNFEPQGNVYISGQTGENILSAMNIIGSTYTVSDGTLGSTKLKDLKDSLGNNLGITSGVIKAYKNGILNNIVIDNNDTLEDLATQLSAYNIQMVYGSGDSGRIYFTSSGNSYLSEAAEGSNLLTALNANVWGEVQNTRSDSLRYEEGQDIVISGSTKLVNLKDTEGNSMGITTGKYKIVANGINYEGTITASTSVNDLFTELARYGISGSINSDGQITLNTANDNTYLVKADGAEGYSTLVDNLFPSWTYGNIYVSDNMDVTDIHTVNMTSETKLKDIDQGTYQPGKFIISSSRSGDTIIELTENSTVGDFMAALSYYGFNSYVDNGRLVIRNDGYTTLKNYTAVPSEASNVISLLGLDTTNWEQPGYYVGSAQTTTEHNTVLEAATRNTTLSNLRDAEGNSLGITTGKYIIYSNGVEHELNLDSTDITLENFMNTLSGYGINTILDTQGGQSVLKIVGSGDSYVAPYEGAGASNVVEKLFGNSGPSTLYDYDGYLQTTELVTTTVIASLATMLSDYNSNGHVAEGIFAFSVNGNYSEINITSYDTFGSLIEKFERAGVHASLTNGVLRLETGNQSFVVDNEHTTSDLITTLGLNFSDNLGGFAASSDAVTQTTTTIEDRTLSVAKYADYDTQLGLLNISSGTISVYRNGAKKLINVDNTETFSQFRSRLQDAFADIDIDFNDGILRFFSTNEGVDVQVGSSNDTSNMSSICGFSQDENGYIVSARELYKVNASSLITTTGLFRYGDVTEGTFIVGDATFNITGETTIQNIVAQINSSDQANASAYWDSVDGKLVISSRSTGASMVNIEAGTSNFTDILGLTTSEWNPDGSVNITRIRLDSQEIGQNAKFSINGTNFQSASNVVTSDVSRIQGLTLNLKSASMGDTVTVTVGKDSEAVTEAVGEFVEAYNELVENVDAELSTGGVLKDQSTLKFIRQQIRNLLVNTFAGATTFRNLAALGISTSAGNSITAGDVSNAGIEYLYFDAEKFLEGYNKDSEAVKNMLVGSDETPGILLQIENIVENALATGSGYFSSADKSYSDKITSINEKIRKANQAIEAYRARLESKFQSMDLLISQMQNQYNSFLNV